MVHQAAVIGERDEYGQAVAAFIVAASGFDRNEFDAWSRQELAGFQRPRTVYQVDELPMTATGKVKRNELAERIVAGPLDPSRPTPHRKNSL
jgi:acyl-coenzyme A synthetase/AMP-(fatty) acid ligase